MFGFCLATVGAMRFLVCIAWAVHTSLFGGNKMNILCKSESCIQELENWKKERIKKNIIYPSIIDAILIFIVAFFVSIGDDYDFSDSQILLVNIIITLIFMVPFLIVSLKHLNKNIIPEYEKFKKLCQQESIIVTNDCLMITLENKNFNIRFYEIQNVSSNIVEPFDSNCFPYSLLKIQTSNNTYYFSSFKNCKVLETIILNNL